MKHSIWFGDFKENNQYKGINTWEDWHLIPASKPLVAPAEPFTNYIDVPGAHGKIDLSEYLTGNVVYKNRSGSFQFFVAGGYGFPEERCNQIMNLLHGKRSIMVLDDEPQYYYTGRFSVTQPQSDSGNGRLSIGINYELEPFKFILPRSSLDEYWDIFLLDDLHGYKFMEKLNAAGNPSFSIPGYSVNGYGYMLDAFIDDSSTFPATVNVTMNDHTITYSRANASASTSKSGTFNPVINATNLISVSGSGLINLVLWGGHL